MEGSGEFRAQVVDIRSEDLDASLLPDALLPPASDVLEEMVERQQEMQKRAGRRGGGGNGNGNGGGVEIVRNVFCVTLFGRCQDGRTVAARVLGYRPHFFVGMHGVRWLSDTQNLAARFLSELRERMPFFLRGEVLSAQVRRRIPFYGYSGGERFDVLEVGFDSLRAFRVAARKLAAQPVFRIGGVAMTAVRYESKLDPMLRLFHTLRLQTCGWFELRPGCRRDSSGRRGFARCDVCVTVDYRDVVPVESYSLAPVRVMSWDIECSSVSGMFPTASKNYSQIASALMALCREARDGLRLPPADVTAFVVLTVMRCLMLEPSGEAAALEERVPAAARFKVPYADTKAPVADAGAVQRAIAGMAEDVRNLALGAVALGRKGGATLNPAPKSQRGIAGYYGGGGGVGEEEVGSVVTTGDAAHAAIVGMLDAGLPALKGDPVIQIGATCNCLGRPECDRRWICTLGSCDDIEGAEVVRCETEEELLMAFRAHVMEADPDVMIGHNVFGFDWQYVRDRCADLGILDCFLRDFGRLKRASAEFKESRASSSAMGDNILYHIALPGVVQVDLMRVLMRSHQLSSYSLNAVSQHFINDQKDDLKPADINVKQRGGPADRAVIARYCLQDCLLVTRLAEMLRVLVNGMGLASMTFVPLPYIFMRGQGIKIYSRVAFETAKREMVIVDHDDVDEDAEDADDEPTYEGATVQPPLVGLHGALLSSLMREAGLGEDDEIPAHIEEAVKRANDGSVGCVDFSSLYPSLMIALMICLSNLLDRKLLPWEQPLSWDPAADPANVVNVIEFDVNEGRGAKKRRLRTERCEFVTARPTPEVPEPSRGVLPDFLKMMLSERKATRAKAEHKRVTLRDGSEVVCREARGGGFVAVADGAAVPQEEVVSVRDEYDDFQKAVLDGQQLALKIIANSTYGLLGASTSAIRCRRAAACVTAAGRQVIAKARAFFEERGWTVVYGDTDSLMVKRAPVGGEGGRLLRGKDALAWTIDQAQATATAFNATLPPPLSLEYEKTYEKYIVVKKKMYAGMLVVSAGDKPKMSFKGLNVTRRDSTPFVQAVQKRLLSCLMESGDVRGAVDAVLEAVDELAEERVPMSMLVTSRRLGDREGYKDPDNVPALQLAERMRAREPGSEPRPGDRVPFVYVRTSDPAAKVGQRIEHPDYVSALGLRLDYQFYIERQLMNPVLILLSAVVDRLPGYSDPPGRWEEMASDLRAALAPEGYADDVLEGLVTEKVNAARIKTARALVFDPVLARMRNKENRQSDLKHFFNVAAFDRGNVNKQTRVKTGGGGGRGVQSKLCFGTARAHAESGASSLGK